MSTEQRERIWKFMNVIPSALLCFPQQETTGPHWAIL